MEETSLLVNTLEASQHQHLATLLGLAEDVKYYIELLSSFLEQQANFVQTHKIKRQQVCVYERQILATSIQFKLMVSALKLLQTSKGI